MCQRRLVTERINQSKVWKHFTRGDGNDRPDGPAVTRLSLKGEVRGSNLGPVKSDAVLQTARHRSDVFSKGFVLPGGNVAEMGPLKLVTRFGIMQRVY